MGILLHGRIQAASNQICSPASRQCHLCGMAFVETCQPIRVVRFIADIPCREAGLIMEVADGQHGLHAAEDPQRTIVLGLKGFRVLRFWNNEVLVNPEAVVPPMLHALSPCPPSTPACGRREDFVLSLERERRV